MRAAALLLVLPLLLLAACKPDAPSATRGADDSLAILAPADSGRRMDTSGTVALLDTSALTRADRCCTFSPAPATLAPETLAGLHAQHFYTDYEVPSKAECVRGAATESVRVNAPGVDDTAFMVMPPDSLMAVEVVRYKDGRTATVAHSGCESYVLYLRLTAPGADEASEAAHRAFVARELRALAAVSSLPVQLGPVAAALARGPLPDSGMLDEMTMVEDMGHGTLPGGHRYADLMVRLGPL